MNSEYAATIVRLPELKPLENCDNVLGAPFWGLQAIVSKNAIPGTLGVLFPTETRLSHEFLHENNLYRHSDRNKDTNAKGYFEDNGRVRAVRFRGHTSNAFWMPLTAFNYLNADIGHTRVVIDGLLFKEGDQFEAIGKHSICEKYVPKGDKVRHNAGLPGEHRVSKKFFPEHMDTPALWRNEKQIGLNDFVTVTQKLHGTSVRFGNVPITEKIGGFKGWVAKVLGLPTTEQKFELIAGSRRVTKDAKTLDGGFYNIDIYTLAASMWGGGVPQGYMVYGELIGWTPEHQPLQKGYTYRVPKGTFELYVYRVSQVNPQGIEVDLSWGQLVEFCDQAGLTPVPMLFSGTWEYCRDMVEGVVDTKLNAVGWSSALPLEQDNPCDEGVVVRVDGLRPKVFKAKNPRFLEFETKQLDKGEIDLESVA